MSDEIKECRICFEPEELDNKLFSPCVCSGTSKYVHYKCLQRWRETNRTTPAYDRCMECGQSYKVKTITPQEKEKLFKINTCSSMFCFFSFINYLFSLAIWGVDGMNNYHLIDTLNFNQTYDLEQPNIKDYVIEDIYSASIFYFTYVSMLSAYLFYLYFIFKTFRNIIRKRLYFSYIKRNFTVSFVYTSLYFFFYYFFVFINQPDLALNSLLVWEILQPYVIWKLVYYHNIAIIVINVDSEEVVLNYYSEDDEPENEPFITNTYTYQELEEKEPEVTVEMEELV